MRRSAHTGGVSDEELPQGARHALLFEAIQRACIRGRFSEAKRPPVCPISHDPWTGGSGHLGVAAAGADGEEFNDSERAATAAAATARDSCGRRAPLQRWERWSGLLHRGSVQASTREGRELLEGW